MKTFFMERMNDLKDLLKHEIMDIASAEQQIIDALPAMIEKASNDQLKNALSDHLRVTEQQKTRLEKVQQLLNGGQQQEEEQGLLTRLFKSNIKCKAMKGILEEGEKMMAEDMSPEVMDAAIIACAQKVEHYEITSYGTVRTWSRELGLEQVTRLLEETLQEEYQADDLLTTLAESRINVQAEKGKGATGNGTQTKTTTPSSSTSATPSTKERAGRRVEELEPVAASRTTSNSRTSTPASGKSSPAKTTTSARTGTTGTRTTASKTAGASSKSGGASGRSISGKSTGSGRGTSTGRGSSNTAGRNKSR